MRSPAWTAVLLAATACSAEPPQAVEPVPRSIYGGTTAGVCQWPTTVLLPEAGCTGTLIHPLIIATASHCGTGSKTALLGETRSRPARTVAVEYCRTFQGDDGPSRTDYAFCKLREPVQDVPIVPVLMGCETEILKAGQKVVVAGFGDSGKDTGYGTKRWVETTIMRVTTTRIQVGGMGKAPCYGDSGGPAFVQLPDGGWRVFGIDSAGLSENCDAGDLMALIHEAVPWIEQQSKIDVTPCHDADGKWNPSPACSGFSLAPDMTGRSWANGCAEPSLSGPVTTCSASTGSPDGGLPDATSPRDLAPDLAPDTRPADAAAPFSPDARVLLPPDISPPEPEPEPEPVPPAATHARGCSCDLGGRAPASGPLWLLLAAALLLPRRRR